MIRFFSFAGGCPLIPQALLAPLLHLARRGCALATVLGVGDEVASQGQQLAHLLVDAPHLLVEQVEKALADGRTPALFAVDGPQLAHGGQRKPQKLHPFDRGEDVQRLLVVEPVVRLAARRGLEEADLLVVAQGPN